jgi:DNA-binding transcriptional LysR family regulator
MNNWDDLRYFLAVARESSVSGAAKVLGVNHSTVTRRIRALEEKHGVRLFERQWEGYEMTDTALSILEQAQAIEDQSQQISRTLFGQDTRMEGRVNLTMPHDIFEHCLAGDLALFQQQYPGIELNLMVTQGLRNLATREADLAIRLTSSPPEYLVGREVAGLQHGVYGLADRPVEDSVGIITWSGDEQLPQWATQYFANAYIALRVDDLSSMYAGVKAGFGIARMPCYMPDSIDSGAVVKLPIELPRSDWSVWVLNHVDLRKTQRVQCCRKFLLEKLALKKNLFEGRLPTGRLHDGA